MSKYRNNKTGYIYFVISEDVIDATNNADSRQMILYEDITGKLYTREEKEFHEKFTRVIANEMVFENGSKIITGMLDSDAMVNWGKSIRRALNCICNCEKPEHGLNGICDNCNCFIPFTSTGT